MNNQQKQIIDKLHNLVKADLDTLKKQALIPLGNNSYEVFDIYRIQHHQQEQKYVVEKNRYSCGKFSSKRSALSWCIADKHNQAALRDKIKELEQKKHHLSADLEVRSRLVENFKNYELRSIADVKIMSRRDKLQAVDRQLDKCINLAKYWQIRGFNDETTRPGRTSSNRTSR